MSIEIECPSGLTGRIRGLEGKDGRYLTDPALNKSGMLPDHILAHVWEETTNPGIYKLGENGKLNWGQALVGDRMYALVQARIAGRDDSMYMFKAQCSEDGCRKAFDWEIDLDDLPVQRLSAAVREQFTAGDFDLKCIVPGTEERRLLTTDSVTGLALLKPKREIVVGTGSVATFRLQTGKDEVLLRKMQEDAKKKRRGNTASDEENAMVDMLLTRTRAIDGVAPDETKAYLEALSLHSIAKLLDRYDEQDCGIDATIEIECPECNTLRDISLPFGSDFFFQRTRKTAR